MVAVMVVMVVLAVATGVVRVAVMEARVVADPQSVGALAHRGQEQGWRRAPAQTSSARSRHRRRHLLASTWASSGAGAGDEAWHVGESKTAG